MANEIFIVGPRQDVTTGQYKHNIVGFDYKDESTGLKLNVRNGDDHLRINGKIVDLKQLNDWLSSIV